ncbi:MAG TPA: flagellar hook-basal body complex protein FliE [Allosphingosinicella sp.]
MSVVPVQAVGAAGLEGLLAPSAAAPAEGSSFAKILMDGVSRVNEKVIEADAQVRAFALDDSIPLHQVTFALEEARMSLEMMLQVRARLVEAYQQVMGMQL